MHFRELSEEGMLRGKRSSVSLGGLGACGIRESYEVIIYGSNPC